MRAAAWVLMVALFASGCAGQQASDASATPARTASAATPQQVEDLCGLATADEIGEIVGSDVTLVGPFTENGDEGCEWSGEGTVIVARASADAGTGLLEGQRDRSESAGNAPVAIGDEAYVVAGAVVFRIGEDVYNVTVVTAEGSPADDERAIELATLVSGRLGG